MVPGSLLGSSLLQAGYGLRELSIPMSRDVNRPGFGGDPAGAHDELIVPRRDRGVQGKFDAFLSDVAIQQHAQLCVQAGCRVARASAGWMCGRGRSAPACLHAPCERLYHQCAVAGSRGTSFRPLLTPSSRRNLPAAVTQNRVSGHPLTDPLSSGVRNR